MTADEMSAPFSDRLVALLSRANKVAAFTGAGISAESGIPTFRDEDGLWSKYNPEELATMDAFLEKPDVVQEWYKHRRSIIHEKEPNAAHRALARLEEVIPEVMVITQNVDNLHQEAGSSRVVELHGNIQRNYCMDCENQPPQEALDRLAEGQPARCPECDGLIRPDVVWFGEALPEEEYNRADEFAQACDVMLSIGTSAVVFPAARIPLTARQFGAYLVDINPERSDLASVADEVIQERAGDVLPDLTDAVAARARSKK